MRHALFVILATTAGLSACAPLPGDPYGYGYSYAPAPAPASYGYYDGGYAPGPYYAEPGYAPYGAPGPTIIVGGERRFDGRDRYRYERQRNEGGFRGNPNQPNREFGRSAPPQNFGGNRPGPSPVAVARPGPGPQNVPPPPSGGAAFEQWNRTHVNASPPSSDIGSR